MAAVPLAATAPAGVPSNTMLLAQTARLVEAVKAEHAPYYATFHNSV
jgi:hypothetical protein